MSSSASTSCTGASAGGALTQLVAQGAMDTYLTVGPTITFYRYKYSKHTPFAIEAVSQNFNNQPNFGSDVQAKIQRTADLLFWTYLEIELPGITACTSTASVCGIGSTSFPCCDPCDPCGDGPAPELLCPSNGDESEIVEDEDDDDLLNGVDACSGLETPYCHWTNAIGQFLVKRACLIIGGQTIDTLYSDYLYMWEELTGKPGKKLREMIGKYDTIAELVEQSKYTRTLYVPLPWWFTRTAGNALPLVSLQFHSVSVHVCFNDLQKCIQTSDCDVHVVKTADCTPLVNADLNARLLNTYVYLDIDERDRFSVGSFEQLIQQTQFFTLCTKQCQLRMQLNFNHPMIELIWAVRRRCQELCNNHFVYSGKWNFDPIKAVSLKLNNLPRFNAKKGVYFRTVQPYQHHTNIPNNFIYCYSFALFPEDVQPSGSANFSRIDNVELIFDLQDALADEDITVLVFGRNHNVFRLRQGLGGIAFSN
jgi:hypothetical protein